MYKRQEREKSKFDARARVQFNAKVNDRTDAVVRLTSGNFELGNSTTGGKANATIDRVYVCLLYTSRMKLQCVTGQILLCAV